MENSNFTLTTTFENNSPPPQQIFSIYIYIYIYAHTHTHILIYVYTSVPLIFILSLLILLYMYVCVCVCVIPLKFCIVLFHARQILMPQPILIAPRGPHRFIPSGEGASPSPFGPLNARGCVHEPPCGGPPWPPLLPGPRKQKIRVRSVTLFSRKFLGHVLRIYVCASEFFFAFDYFDYGFSPKILFTALLSMDIIRSCCCCC